MTPRKTQKPADAVDAQLERYRSMRDFAVTDEPSGKHGRAKSKKEADLPFVIQKHAASHLHYDFRLGWNGVLKSWAVTKGPSCFPGDKRLAVQVEDHPIEYGGFEGIIPKGQYGGGTVMIWDQGTWSPQPGHADVDEGLRKGSLKFILNGDKLHGKWTLIRMGGKAASENKPNWLLIKEHDQFERGQGDQPITEEAQNSVVTGRSIEQITQHEDHVWDSKKTKEGNAWYRKEDIAETSKKNGRSQRALAPSPTLKKAPSEALPNFIDPQLATPATTPPSSAGWLHELKLDGYRIQARKDEKKVQLLTRKGLDWTHRMKTIASQVADLPVKQALLDGEVVVLLDNGTTSFADLQAAFQEGAKRPLTYFAFDLLHLDGHNLRNLPLRQRKELLSNIVSDAGEFIRYSDHIEADGKDLFRKACELHAEGIISKKAAGPYVSGRTSDWLKLKCIHEQEFVIGGFTLPSSGIYGVGALLLGYYEDGHLICAGRSGTGFTQKSHRALRTQLDRLKQAKAPFHGSLPPDAKRDAIWVQPALVAQITFATWTADGLVRQAAFKGIREDKPPSEVQRETSNAPLPRRRKDKVNDSTAAKSSSEPTQKTETAPVRLTHPDKVVDPKSKVTKRELADYYWAISSHILPHIANRPLSLVRCPDGIGHPCFFQKHVNQTLPPGIDSVEVTDKKSGKPEPYITLSSPEAVAGLAQMGVLEIHPWSSCNETLEQPDRVIFDLDPDESISWKVLAESAAEVRQQLKDIGLISFLKTTGGKGLHVAIPIQPDHEWPQIKEFAHQFVLAIEQLNPKLYLTKMTKAARKGKIYLDYLRNERGATAVAPFSPRARAGMNVSLPLSWSDLKSDQRPAYQVSEFSAWKKRLSSDPWKEFFKLKQRLSL
jgi:bifunctional non-homologous end joining protein LigD